MRTWRFATGDQWHPMHPPYVALRRRVTRYLTLSSSRPVFDHHSNLVRNPLAVYRTEQASAEQSVGQRSFGANPAERNRSIHETSAHQSRLTPPRDDLVKNSCFPWCANTSDGPDDELCQNTPIRRASSTTIKEVQTSKTKSSTARQDWFDSGVRPQVPVSGSAESDLASECPNLDRTCALISPPCILLRFHN